MTTALREHVESLFEAAMTPGEPTPALFVIGSPGAGKSTIMRRVAAQLALERKCVVADPGPRLDPLDDEEIHATRDGLAELRAVGRPVLLVLDDPFFAGSPWPDVLRRLRHLTGIAVLAASPTLQFERHQGSLPNSVRAERRDVGHVTAAERRRVATLHGRDPAELDTGPHEFLAVAMEAAAGQPFDEIVRSIWRTLNDGQPISSEALPGSLPWLVRAYLIVAYFHRFEVVPREALVRAALEVGEEPPAVRELVYRVAQLRAAQGWSLFQVIAPTNRVGWAGPAIATTHATIARAAWGERPVPWFDLGEWIIPAAIATPAGAFEMGELAAAMLLAEREAGEALITGLSEAWLTAIERREAEPRNLALFVAGGKRLDSRFPGFDRTFEMVARQGGPQAWLAAYQLYRNSEQHSQLRTYPTSIQLERLIDEADFSIAESRSVSFVRSLPAEMVPRVWARLGSALEGSTGWTPTGGAFTAMFVANSNADEVDVRVPQLLEIVASGRNSYGVLAAMLVRAHEYSRAHAVAIATAAIRELEASSGEPVAHVIADGAAKAASRLFDRYGDDASARRIFAALTNTALQWRKTLRESGR